MNSEQARSAARERLIAAIEKANALDEELTAAITKLSSQWMEEHAWEARKEAAKAEVRRIHLEYELLKERPINFALSSS
jgi:adenine C2-methylase RlmN of 23S rRNA A2503 and tRNA A37